LCSLPANCDGIGTSALLATNDRKNEDTLRVASETLTSKIQANWTQGKDLNFWLGYVGNDQGVITPKSPSWETELRAQIVAKENKSLGKRTEEILTTLFGEPLGKIWIARKYGELLRSEDSRLSAGVEQYWNE
jgi:hypothetical protein